jgi:diguanylate cyclase (GGDEF)-like protein
MNVGARRTRIVRWFPTTTVPIARAASGMLIAIGCPLGLLLIRAAEGHSPRTEVRTHLDVYVYMLLGLTGVVTSFGYALGRVEEKLRRANRQLETLASIDALTGLSNARAFHERLPGLISLARRAAIDLAVVMFDIDHFKDINDTYGHAVGDRVLRAIGAALASGRRREDVAARVGGEEFALVLPGVSASGAEAVAERVLAAVRTVSVEGVAARVTISAGVTALRDGDSHESIFARADAGLYDAKRRGRNCVEVR